MSGKHKTTLIPTHPLWAAFYAVLGERLQVAVTNDGTCVCGHRQTMPHSMHALSFIGLAQRNVLLTREYFRSHGLNCDCAVWNNPDVLLTEPPEERPPWIDSDGNYDADAFYWHEIRDYDD